MQLGKKTSTASTCTWKNLQHNLVCDEPTHETSSGFCILHSRHPNKNRTLFNERVSAKLSADDYNFAGVFFPDGLDLLGSGFANADFRYAEFAKEAGFGLSQFSGKTDFSGATFRSKTIFYGAKFLGEANFSSAKCEGDVTFQGAVFRGSADFSLFECTNEVVVTSAEFQKEAKFSGSKFKGNADFLLTKFHGNAHFSEVKFGGATDFSKAEFDRMSDFTLATLASTALFPSAKFGGVAIFAHAKFVGLTSFYQAKFSDETFFADARFHADAIFHTAKFGAKTQFLKTSFDAEVIFPFTTFNAEAEFWGAEFRGGAHFDSAKFKKGANFESARFFREANFTETEFIGRVTFYHESSFKHIFKGVCTFLGVIFGGKAYFTASQFNGPVDFSRAQFADAAFFSPEPLLVVGSGDPPAHEPKGMQKVVSLTEQTNAVAGVARSDGDAGMSLEMCLENVFLERPDRVRFENLDLRSISFGGTNLRGVRFHNCRWPRKGHRIALYDEVSDDPANPETLRLLYRDLKANFEDARDYVAAGDFYYGEMEIARRYDKRRTWRWLLTAFWLLAGYAERPLRCFLVFCGLVVLSASFLLLPWATFTFEIAHNVVDSWHLSPLEALGHSIRAVFLRSPFFQPESKWAHTVTLAANIFGPLQLAFLVIALRRRFRR